MIFGRSHCPFFHLPDLLLIGASGAHRFHLRARNIRARAMISTTPSSHIPIHVPPLHTISVHGTSAGLAV